MALSSGDKAPQFKLLNKDGTEVDLKSYKGKKVVIYFYPKANTPGCTKQTCLLNDSLEELKDLQTEVIGISPDAVDKQLNFSDKYNISFPLLSDEDHSVAEKYSVWGEKKMYGNTYMGIIRSAFLIDEKGKVIEAWYKITPKDTVAKVLKKLKTL